MYCARGGASMPMSCSARVDERHLVGEARQPVDAVDQRGDLRVRAELGELLVAAVHVADDRVGGDHALAVEAHDEAQRAVGRRVLRPEVEDHVAGVELDVHLRVGEVPAARRGSISNSGSWPASGVGARSSAHLLGGRCSSSSPASSPGIGSTSTRPGHGFTSRASSGKSLRSGWPSNSDGR